MSRVGLVYSDIYLHHLTGDHPECPARLEAIVAHLQQSGLWETLRVFQPRAADVEDLLTVHTEEHVFRVERFCREGKRWLDPDTVVSPESFDVARAAVGGVFVAIDQVMLREVDRAMALVRPPGHHAGADRAAGFCLFNNVALGARYAQRRHGLGKVLIVDFDVHHGNGTQAIFEEDDSVFYFSMHRWPFYPGTGAADRKGTGRGKGFTFNLPLSAVTSRETTVSLFAQSLDDIAERFAPDIVLVSAGFDGYADDPIAGLGLAAGDFRAMTESIVALAQKACAGRVVSALEGGYNLKALGGCVEQHLKGLMEA